MHCVGRVDRKVVASDKRRIPLGTIRYNDRQRFLTTESEAMPVHNWKRVKAGIFHDFHHEWISTIRRSLNDGLLPPFFSAIHPTFKTPAKGTAVIGFFVALLAGFLPLDALLALTNIGETLDGQVQNVHFQDELANGKMTFDYTLREGVVTKSNGLELMRSIGLDV